MRRLLSRALAGASLIALIGGCTTVGPDFKTPEAPTAAAYSMSGENLPAQAALGDRLAGDWWSLYRSPEIDQVVRQAVAGNRSLQSAQASLDQARDAVLAQPGLASAEATAQVARDRVNLSSFGFSQFPLPGGQTLTLSNPTFTLYSFGASGRYDFDLFGQHKRQHEALEAQAEAQARRVDAAYLTLTAQAVSQAIDIASLKAQIAAAEEIVSSDQSNLDVVTKAYKLGGGTKLDVSTVETELATDEGQITPLRQRLAAANHALALLVGQAPAGWSPPDFQLDRIGEPASIPVELPSELVRDRPDILAAEARLHAATAQIGIAKADLYPKLSLTAEITQAALHPQDLFSYDATGFLLGPGVSLPLLGRSELKAKTRMAEDAARAALADYQQVVLQAFVQVADSLQALIHDQEAIGQADRALNAASESLRLQRLRHQDGKATLLPVLDAQRSWARARLTAVRARAQKLQDSAALLYAVSKPWPQTQTAEAPRTPNG